MKTIGIVLAAGFGTRLRPSTEHCPKPLIPVAGIEPLFHALHTMNLLGFSDAIVNAHYLPDKIERALKLWQPLFPKMRLHFSLEKEILGTAGGILQMMDSFPEIFENASAMVFNGDTLAGFELDCLKKLITNESTFAYSLHSQHLERYKPLWINSQEEWVGIGPTPPKPGATAAHFLSVHFLAEKDVTYLRKQRKQKQSKPEFVDLFNGIYRPLVSSGAKIRGIRLMTSNDVYTGRCFWFDMTNVEFLLEAQQFLLNCLEEDSSSPLSPWEAVLKARYPGICEIERGVWYLGQEGAIRPQQRGPSLYIEECSAQNLKDDYNFDLGPFSTVIRQGVSGAVGKNCNVNNSVVLITQDSSGEPTSSGDIIGEVRVI